MTIFRNLFMAAGALAIQILMTVLMMRLVQFIFDSITPTQVLICAWLGMTVSIYYLALLERVSRKRG